MNRYKKILVFMILTISFSFFSTIFILDINSKNESYLSILITREFKNLNLKNSYFEFYFPENYN
ncbi:MAG: hypothetical protein ACK4YF_07065, partial [Exilispira sp.]